MDLIETFIQDDAGATAIEYGLIAAMVSVAIIATLGALSDNLVVAFETVAEALDIAADAG